MKTLENETLSKYSDIHHNILNFLLTLNCNFFHNFKCKQILLLVGTCKILLKAEYKTHIL